MAPRTWKYITLSGLFAVLAVACDQWPEPLDPQPQAAKSACPPGQAKKGCATDPPTEPPADLHLPPVVLDQMISPLRMGHTPMGWILLTDSRLQMVLRIDPGTLAPIEGFETSGRPLGVTGLGESIFVGNATDQTIDVYSAAGGGFTTTFGPGTVHYPADLEADFNMNLIFALDGGRRDVRVFDEQGQLVSVISGPGTADDRLENPTALGLDPVRQWVMVSDYGSLNGGIASLKIFGYDGTFLTRVSGEGSCGMLGCSGGFSRPQGAEVDAAGLVYLPDALLAQVLVFDPATWDQTDTYGTRGFLRVPTDVRVDDLGDLFVASNRTRDVKVFRGVGGAP